MDENTDGVKSHNHVCAAGYCWFFPGAVNSSRWRAETTSISQMTSRCDSVLYWTVFEDGLVFVANMSTV